jgi:ABC-type phosphate transport system substrate-binding protein
MTIKRFIGGLLLAMLFSTAALAEEIAVIANSAFPKDALTATQIKDIYLGKVEIIGSERVKPIDQKDTHPLKKAFVGKILDMTIEDYKGYWMKRVFRDGGAPPAVKPSTEETISAVRDDKGAIGYVYAEEAKGKPGVRVVHVFIGF